MTLITNRHKTNRYQSWSSPLIEGNAVKTFSVVRSIALLRTTKGREFLHVAASRTIMPLRKPDKRNFQVRMLHSRCRYSIIRWQPKMVDSQSCLKTFLFKFEIYRAFFFCEWPSIKTTNHQRFISGKVNHATNPPGGNELGASYRFHINLPRQAQDIDGWFLLHNWHLHSAWKME